MRTNEAVHFNYGIEDWKKKVHNRFFIKLKFPFTFRSSVEKLLIVLSIEAVWKYVLNVSYKTAKYS
jgi:capsule polysaccharide export protein KpsC/LpsZ